MGMVPRIVKANAASDLFTLATYILSIPRIQTEALVVFPGMGEDERVIHAVKRWIEEDFSYLFVAGLNLKEKTALEFSIETLCKPPFNLPTGIMEGGVFTQIHADHTAHQAQWTAEMVRKYNIHSLTITAPVYHLPRAYLTMLKALRKEPVVLIPDPTPMSPLAIVSELDVHAGDMIPGEIERIRTYQKKGDVATYEECMRYLAWLYWECSRDNL